MTILIVSNLFLKTNLFMWYNYTRASNLNAGDSGELVSTAVLRPRGCVRHGACVHDRALGLVCLSIFRRCFLQAVSFSTAHPGSPHGTSEGRCVWKPGDSCPDLNGVLHDFADGWKHWGPVFVPVSLQHPLDLRLCPGVSSPAKSCWWVSSILHFLRLERAVWRLV